eukprot:1158035-Pelagomonas_calceolata.AAC.1
MAGRRAVVGPLSATGSQVAELSMPLPSSIEIYPCISGSHTIPQALAPCTPCCQGTRIFLIARAAYSFLQHSSPFKQPAPFPQMTQEINRTGSSTLEIIKHPHWPSEDSAFKASATAVYAF